MAKASQPSVKKPVKSVSNDTTPKSTTEKVTSEKTLTEKVTNGIKRSFTGTKEVFTDLFKLMVADVIKYEGWEKMGVEHPDTHPSKFSTWPHSHPFRTYDRKGDKQTTCTPIGGHFHVIEWEKSEDEDSPPTIKKVSGPMVMEKKIVRGRPTNVPVPANEFDEHTHDVEYIRSSKIEFTTTNVEATKVIAYEAQKGAPIAGVTVK
jgi:hypothetical protein